MADYVASRVQDPVSRVPGVGDIRVLGGQSAMRIWVDPFKLQNYRLTFADVKSAIQAQNAQVSAGKLGTQPAAEGQPLTATVTAQSRLQNVYQCKTCISRTNPDGSPVKNGDTARTDEGRG